MSQIDFLPRFAKGRFRIRGRVGLKWPQPLPKLIPFDWSASSGTIYNHGQDSDEPDLAVAGKIFGTFFGSLPKSQILSCWTDDMDKSQRFTGRYGHLPCQKTGRWPKGPVFLPALRAEPPRSGVVNTIKCS